MKVKFKMILITIITVLLMLNLPLYSNALSFDEILEAGDSFIEINDPDTITIAPKESELAGISQTVSNVLLTIALCVTLISAVVMGINFTIQSVEDKAKVKESMIPWIIGMFVSFGAYGIWRITMQVFYNLN